MSQLTVTTEELQGVIDRIERLYPDTKATNDPRYIAKGLAAQQAANILAEFLNIKLLDKLDILVREMK